MAGAAPIGILGAMEQEVGLLRARLDGPEDHRTAGRRFTTGHIDSHPVVVAVSGFGKVAAAATTSSLLDLFGASPIVFSGVAGGIGPGIAIGDVVVADALVQHDFDASPVYPPFVIPSLGVPAAPTDQPLKRLAVEAAGRYLEVRFDDDVPAADRHPFGIGTPRVHTGLIASGDRFIADPAEAARLATSLPGLLAVEMEGAALAQVCTERSTPFAVIRTISDHADLRAPIDFGLFVTTIAARVGAGIVEELVAALPTASPPGEEAGVGATHHPSGTETASGNVQDIDSPNQEQQK